MNHKTHDCFAYHGYWMAPIYGKHPNGADAQGMPDHVFAPNLDEAFALARCKWPTACGWICQGKVDPKDPERLIRSKRAGAGTVERIVREEPKRARG